MEDIRQIEFFEIGLSWLTANFNIIGNARSGWQASDDVAGGFKEFAKHVNTPVLYGLPIL